MSGLYALEGELASNGNFSDEEIRQMVETIIYGVTDSRISLYNTNQLANSATITWFDNPLNGWTMFYDVNGTKKWRKIE